MRLRLGLGVFVVLIGCGGSDEPAPSPPATAAYASCRGDQAPAASCGTDVGAWDDLIAGDDRAASLEPEARRRDRLFHALHGHTTGLNTEIVVSSAAGQDAVSAFAASDDWDFEASTGMPVSSAVDSWAKVAGAYAGVGIAANAFRYGTLRDRGASCDEVERAREHLLSDLDALHLASAITGAEGVIARGFARKDVPGTGQNKETTPLFDDAGQPLPEEKNNGTWREDNSEGGLYGDYVWEDSCSRDQFAGWITGYGALWEVIADDDAIPADLKARLQADAAALARSLMEVRDKGYDLEIWDADGRRTFHGIMNENGIDTGYLPGAGNGFNALMSLGVVAALAYVAEESDIFAYLEEQLITERELHLYARDNMLGVDQGEGSNFSSYNMAFLGGWLAQRYLCNDDARAVVTEAIATSLYDRGDGHQPAEQKQTLYDFVHAVASSGATAYRPMQSSPDPTAVTHGMDSLVAFPASPFFATERLNCDDDEIAAGTCLLEDGTTTVTLLGEVGWNDKLVAAEPIPMELRPASNYFWRSDPYAVNGGGDGTALFPGVDFRFTYWLARWVR